MDKRILKFIGWLSIISSILSTSLGTVSGILALIVGGSFFVEFREMATEINHIELLAGLILVELGNRQHNGVNNT